MYRTTGATVSLLDSPRLWKLWLKGQPKGITSLEKDVEYLINATWAGSEIARWQKHKVGLTSAPPSKKTLRLLPAPTIPEQEPLTKSEKRWLDANYDGEFKFLLAHNLHMHKDEDREEGRAIMRKLMAKGKAEDEAEEVGDEYENSQFLKDLREDPMSHLADRHFTHEQLDWIEKHYRHSGSFLWQHGLKAFDDDDCKKGRRIAEAMMRND